MKNDKIQNKDILENFNDGKAYEVFVQKMQQAILDAEPYAAQKNITVEHNKILCDRCNCRRQFDIYWEYEMGGYTYKNVIECKDYERGVSIEKIDSLIGKMHDLPGVRAIIATRVKFQEGAKQKAAANNIDIIIVRDENEQKDWLQEDGTHLIKEIHINVSMKLPIQIMKFNPIFDLQWANEHGIKEFSINSTDAEILLENVETGKKQSLHDYFESIPRNKTRSDIVNTHKEDFKNLFLCSNGQCIKVNSIEVDYIAPALVERKIKIAPEVMGVIEYLNEKKKIMVLQKSTNSTAKIIIMPLRNDLSKN